MRCVQEASQYENNCFITLTYNDENLPETGSLNKHEWQSFMKRLRASVYPKKIPVLPMRGVWDKSRPDDYAYYR